MVAVERRRHMLLTPRTFHRAGGFASWLHLCCCACPESLDVTFVGVEAALCSAWSSLSVDGTYSVPFVSTSGGGTLRNYSVSTGGTITATNTSGCVYNDSAVTSINIVLYASNCSIKTVQVLVTKVSGACSQTSAEIFDSRPPFGSGFSEGTVILGDTINNLGECPGINDEVVSEVGTAVVVSS